MCDGRVTAIWTALDRYTGCYGAMGLVTALWLTIAISDGTMAYFGIVWRHYDMLWEKAEFADEQKSRSASDGRWCVWIQSTSVTTSGGKLRRAPPFDPMFYNNLFACVNQFLERFDNSDVAQALHWGWGYNENMNRIFEGRECYKDINTSTTHREHFSNWRDAVSKSALYISISWHGFRGAIETGLARYRLGKIVISSRPKTFGNLEFISLLGHSSSCTFSCHFTLA